MSKQTSYTVQLFRNRKGAEPHLVAEIEVEGSEHGPIATAEHYAKHARLFMRHIRFDRAVAVAK